MVPGTKLASSAGSSDSNSATVHRSLTSPGEASTSRTGTSLLSTCWWCGSTTMWVTAGTTGSTTTRSTVPAGPSVQVAWAPIATGSVPSMGVLLGSGIPTIGPGSPGDRKGPTARALVGPGAGWLSRPEFDLRHFSATPDGGGPLRRSR